VTGRRVLPRLHALLAVLTLAAGLGLSALAAAPAGAAIVKLPSGRYANLATMTGASASPAAAVPRGFDSYFSNLDYNGGPVMASNTNYTVAWEPSNDTGSPFPAGYVSGIDRFFADLQAASGTSAGSDAVATQYYDAAGDHAAWSSTDGGVLVDTDPLPASGCTASSGYCLTDSQLTSELDSFLNAHGEPADLSHEYFLLTPPNVSSCTDAGGTECSANAAQSQMYCAYHSVTGGGHVWANIPDLVGTVGCDPFVTMCPSGQSCQYDNSPADGVLSAVSHEHDESLTDPRPDSGWNDFQPGCTSTSPMTCGGEIGDKCNLDAFEDPNVQLQTSGSTDTPYNETINGDHYLIQMEWSNAGHRCLDAFPPNPTAASAAFTDHPDVSSDTVDFDASASSATGGVAEYVWQFNDAGGPNNTVETTSPQISHLFPSTGVYTVALTVMALDGTSATSTATIDVGSASSPAARINATGSSAGAPVSFSASTSTDPNAGAALQSYAWNFGDGTTATGATPAPHTYPGARDYTVTLTVTDSDGLSDSVSQVVSLAGSAPVAAFGATPAAPTVGTQVQFDGSASNQPGGSISSYAWDFGDGSSGTGATPTHVYSSAGTFPVTLTVTAADGQTAQISHTIQVLGNPIAVFTAPSGTAGQALTFDGSASQAPGGTIAAYAWSFGDGSTGSGERATHAYVTPGLYTVRLTVWTASGASSQASGSVLIGPGAARVSFTTPGGLAGSRIPFSAWVSDPGATVVAYSWTFGDGGSGTGARPEHVYARAGRYTVTLTVIDNAGQTASFSQVVGVGSVACVVPRLAGASLSAARRALAAAHCRTGRVRKPRSHPRRRLRRGQHWRLVVRSASYRRGARRAAGTPVALQLGYVVGRG
jgi:PKD repeat protein